MLRRVAGMAWVILLLCTSAWGQNLSGAWSVTGALPDGEAFAGHAVWSPQQQADRYTVAAQVTLAGGEVVRWQATATQAGDAVETRHWRPGTGMSQVLAGGGQAEAVRGRYTLAGDALSGEFGDAAEPTEVTYTRLDAPQVRFDAPLASVEAGGAIEVGLSVEPAELAELIVFDAPRGACTWSLGDGLLAIEGRQAGHHALVARLGRGGAVLATLELEVRPDTLQRVLELVRREANDGDGLVPVVIFDLDDTLFDTRYRTLRILHEYAEAQQETGLEVAQPEQVHYDLEQTLAELGYDEAARAALQPKLRGFWVKRFFRDERLADDGVYPGAVDYVHELVAAGAQIAYVTGRKTPALAPSRAKLEAEGYPVVGQHYFFKPPTKPWEPKLETPVFKGQVAADELPELGEVVAAFDNEPENCNAFRANLPDQAIVVHLDTLYPPDAHDLVAGVEVLGSEAYRR